MAWPKQDGDSYTICACLRSKERPAALLSKPGSGTILQILKQQEQGLRQALIEVGRRELAATWQAVS
jgi:hypothetical protein